jgi:hypothetical protein
VAHPCASPRSALGFVPASSTRAWANRQRGRGLFFEAGWSRWSACVSRVGCAVSAAALVLPHRPTYDVRQSQKNTCLQDLKPGNSKVPERCALEILRTQSVCRHRDSLTTNGFAINLQPVKDHRKHREASRSIRCHATVVQPIFERGVFQASANHGGQARRLAACVNRRIDAVPRRGGPFQLTAAWGRR